MKVIIAFISFLSSFVRSRKMSEWTVSEILEREG